jgi:hypothetical protein
MSFVTIANVWPFPATAVNGIRDWTAEETTFMLTLYCESGDDFKSKDELFKFIADELRKHFALTVTANDVQVKYEYITSQSKAINAFDLDNMGGDEEAVRKATEGMTTRSSE